jgi:glycosyltransferase involved in cell wall biosynthesis
MHNILWQDYARDLKAASAIPELWKQRTIKKYKAQEERAWQQFDGLITINQEEHKYVEVRTAKSQRLFYAPMGTDLRTWPYSWKPSQPVRLAYYGGLGSQHNQRDALKCYENIMPTVWRDLPEAELWLIGSHPPESLRALTSDPRIKVTGFVKDAQSLLATMSVVLCPWTGTYGFRSRLIEVMALGVPLVASHDAVYGMGLEHDKGLLLGTSDEELAGHAMRLLTDDKLAAQQSQLARQSVERLYSVGNTYDRLMNDLREWMIGTTRKIA